MSINKFCPNFSFINSACDQINKASYRPMVVYMSADSYKGLLQKLRAKMMVNRLKQCKTKTIGASQQQ